MGGDVTADAAIDYAIGTPDVDAFAALFETTGWNAEYRLAKEELSRALDQSDIVVGAYSGETLVGVGRVVSDGAMHALLVDVIVEPAFQGRGIGTAVMQRLLDHCLGRNIRDIQLFCARGKRAFYERLGFRARDDDAPGMEYVGARPDRDQ